MLSPRIRWPQNVQGVRIFFLGSLFLLGACSATWNDWTPWAYLYDIGDAKAMTQWALAQNDINKIDDALEVLSRLMLSKDLTEAKQAADGWVSLIKKLEGGWPGLVLMDAKGAAITVLREAPPGTITIHSIIIKEYLGAEEILEAAIKYHHPENSVLIADALLRVKPSDEYPSLVKSWTQENNQVQEQIQKQTTELK